MSESKHETRGARPTIGFLTANVHDGTAQAIWSGVVDAAQRHDVNLICFLGQSVHSPSGFHAQANVLYDLVSAERLDGLLYWTSSVGRYLDRDENLAFLQRYGLPAVSFAPLEGIPSVFADSYYAMREEVTHLIESHGCRRLALIGGPEGHPATQRRYQAYRDALQEHQIPFDPNLVTPPGTWHHATGVKGIALLLDERGLRPGIDFEAVVAASDILALGVLEALQERGVGVPEDVALVGFNDLPEGRVATPPLTSVAMPFYEEGVRGMEALLALLAGEDVPEQILLEAILVVRQSCGCQSQAVSQAMTGSLEPRQRNLNTALKTRREEILSEMAQAALMPSVSLASRWAEQLLDAFAADLETESPGSFVAALNEVLRQVSAMGSDMAAWQNVLSALRRSLLPYLEGDILVQAEGLWQQARVVVGEAIQRACAHQALQAEQQAQTLREFVQSLITTFDVQSLMEVLADGLPKMGIPSAYLSLYENPDEPVGRSKLVLAYGDEGPVGLGDGGACFPSSQLVPEGMTPQRRCSYMVEPLYFQKHQIGFVLFEVGPREGTVYEVLQSEISSALEGALLVQRVLERSAELARQQYILDTFMENVPDSIYFKDLESCITRTNRAHAAKLGLSDPAEEIGKSDLDFFPEEQARIKFEQEKEIIRTGKPILNLEEADGLGHWALTTKMPLRDEKGEIIGTFGISRDITAMKEAQAALEKAYAEVERQVAERTAELKREQEESARLQQEVIEAQQRAIRELSTPIIPVLEGVIVMPLIGSIDTLRARDVTRSLLAGIREHGAKVVILDITGVPIVDSGVAAYLNKTVQAARLKGARTIVTGISEAVAETIVDLGIDWSGIETLRDLRTGLRAALQESRAAR